MSNGSFKILSVHISCLLYMFTFSVVSGELAASVGHRSE